MSGPVSPVAAALKLKVCGVTRAQDVRACRAAGVDAIGINLWPGSKRHLDLAAAGRMLAEAGPTPTRVGVFVDAPLDEVAQAVRALDLAAIQPHGDADPRPYAALAGELGVDWIWVVRGTPNLDRLEVPTPEPAWILLDAAVPGFGGAGHRTDWDWAAAAVRHLAPRAVWLAGGVRPDNVAEAVARVRPAGLDVASGAEFPGAARGEKDPAAIAALVAACR